MGVVLRNPDHIQAQINYLSGLFTAGTAQPLLRAPFAGELTFVAFVVIRAITGGPSDVDFNVVGGGSNPLATLSTGAGTVGLTVTQTFDPPLSMAEGEILVAASDGAATGNSEVAVFAEFRST